MRGAVLRDAGTTPGADADTTTPDADAATSTRQLCSGRLTDTAGYTWTLINGLPARQWRGDWQSSDQRICAGRWAGGLHALGAVVPIPDDGGTEAVAAPFCQTPAPPPAPTPTTPAHPAAVQWPP